MDPIEVKEHGLIEHITLPVSPGVKIFRGPNDCGKSVLLEGLSRTLGNQRAKAACRTGQKQGSITGMGVRLTVSKRTAVKGVLVVDSIEGRYTVADLVDPHIKDPVAADTRRIHALLSLNGVEADPIKFHDLLPGGAEQFVSIVGPVEGSDLVELAGVIKRRFEAAARDAARRADDFALQADACRIACEDVDTSVETNTEELETRLLEAAGHSATLEERSKAAGKAHEEAVRVATLLSEAKAEYTGPTREDAYAKLECLRADYAEWDEKRRQAASKAETLKNGVDVATAALRTAEIHVRTVARWQASIDATIACDPPSADDVAEAARKVTEARRAIENGRLARDAIAKQERADGHRGEAEIHAAQAESLRQAALGTDDVLSNAVDSETLTVVGGRLMTPTEDRGLIPFGERSQGYRADVAIREAIKLLKAQGTHESAIIIIPQELWEGLQPKLQKAIDAQSREAGVTIYTAEAVDEELHVTAFDGDGQATE